MVWAKTAVACGLLVLLAAFGIGTERQLATTYEGRPIACGPAISASWLVSGTHDATSGTDGASAACGPVINGSRTRVLWALGAGGLVTLVGWTALGDRRRALPATVAVG